MTAAHASAKQELISVAIGDNLYAFDIMLVREIRGWTASTPLPHAPADVLGMINLRGSILPVIDLGARLGLGPTETGASSVVVVTEIHDRPVGLLVNAVCDILTIAEGGLQDPPEVGEEKVQAFVSAVMSTDDGIVCILRLDDVMPRTEAVELLEVA